MPVLFMTYDSTVTIQTDNVSSMHFQISFGVILLIDVNKKISVASSSFFFEFLINFLTKLNFITGNKLWLPLFIRTVIETFLIAFLFRCQGIQKIPTILSCQYTKKGHTNFVINFKTGNNLGMSFFLRTVSIIENILIALVLSFQGIPTNLYL